MLVDYIILRLKVERFYSKKTYDPTIIQDIVDSVKRFKPKHELFEVTVRLKSDQIKDCFIKMAPEILEYFVASYGSVKEVEKYFEVVKIG